MKDARYATSCPRCAQTVIEVQYGTRTVRLQEPASKPFRIDFKMPGRPVAFPMAGIYVDHEPLCIGNIGEVSS